MPQFSVGCVLVGQTDDFQDAVILQRRAATEPLLDNPSQSKPQSFAGALQLSWAGKLDSKLGEEPNDVGFEAAFRRKAGLELGPRFLAALDPGLADGSWERRLLNKVDEEGRVIRNFGIKVNCTMAELLALIEKAPQIEELVVMNRAEAATLQPLVKDLHKAQGVPTGENRMFQDEIDTVNLAFETFRHSK